MLEAKPYHKELERGLKEAEEYAQGFQGNGTYQALFISGVAGNPRDPFLVQTKVFDGTAFVSVTLNGIPATGLLSQEALQTILRTRGPGNLNLTASLRSLRVPPA